MSRSLKKGPFIDRRLYNKIKTMEAAGKKEPLKTYSRSSTIVPKMVGHTIMVYNGKKFIPIHISENLIGHKLGEFSPTRIFKMHAGDRK